MADRVPDDPAEIEVITEEMRQLADEIVAGLREGLGRALGADSGVWSVCVSGSYARGDFIEGNSDLDLNIVYEPGRSGAFPVYDDGAEPGRAAIQGLIGGILAERTFHSHSPHGLDVAPLLWEWIPKRTQDARLPEGSANFRYFNVFMFDFLENLLVLWGDDPRVVMPAAPDPRTFAAEWFRRSQALNEHAEQADDEWRVPFRAFVSIQIAQIVFGERTLDKWRLLDLYEAHVPEFPMKAFGAKMIRDKVEARYPERPCKFAPRAEYVGFERQLGEVTIRALG